MSNEETRDDLARKRQLAEILFHDLKEMQRATFTVQADYGRWLIGSLLLVHGGALFGLFSFLGDLADKPQALAQYQWTIWWFVAGLLLTLSSGLATWLNWSLISESYNQMASYKMLWDPNSHWTGEVSGGRWIPVTYWASLALGICSALCIVGGAYATLNGNWIPELIQTAIT